MVSAITEARTVTIDQPQHTLYGGGGEGRRGQRDEGREDAGDSRLYIYSLKKGYITN